MTIADDVASDVDSSLREVWNTRDGTVVPETEDVALAGGGVKFGAVMLYVDLVDSTDIAIYDRRVAAKLFRAFLSTSSRLIRYRNGYVRSFDGDRVMGVFLGNDKNSDAATCAVNIAWAVTQVIRPRFGEAYEVFRNRTYKINHCTGIDRSDVLVVRAGIRNNNDLVWVGRAPNVAAKLSSMRVNPYFTTYITYDVYSQLNDVAKFTVKPENLHSNMWEQIQNSTFYRSTWYRSPDL